jgi:hypothetical protein
MKKCRKIQMKSRPQTDQPQIRVVRIAIRRTEAAIRGRKKVEDRLTNIKRNSRRVQIKIISKRKMKVSPWKKALTKLRQATRAKSK